MSISRQEFEKGRRDPYVLLLEFLRGHDLAFTLDYLLQVLIQEGYNIPRERLQEALAEWERAGQVQSKEIEGERYYTYRRRPLGFRPESGR